MIAFNIAFVTVKAERSREVPKHRFMASSCVAHHLRPSLYVALQSNLIQTNLIRR